MADDDLVRMVHTEFPVPEPPWTTERAFRTVWAPRGWIKADDATLAAADILGRPVPALEDLTKPELLEVAANLEVEDVGARTKKEDVVEAIRSAPTVAASSAVPETTEEA